MHALWTRLSSICRLSHISSLGQLLNVQGKRIENVGWVKTASTSAACRAKGCPLVHAHRMWMRLSSICRLSHISSLGQLLNVQGKRIENVGWVKTASTSAACRAKGCPLVHALWTRLSSICRLSHISSLGQLLNVQGKRIENVGWVKTASTSAACRAKGCPLVHAHRM